MDSDTAAVACSLGPSNMDARVDEWTDLLARRLVEVNAIPGGVRLVLQRSPAASSELRRLIALERSCCAWINWAITEGDHLEVHATADEEQGTALLRQWVAAPTLLPTGLSAADGDPAAPANAAVAAARH